MNRESAGIRRTATVARIILALVFFVFGLMYFFTPIDKMPIDPATPDGAYMAALLATGFFLPFLKAVETIAGLMMFWKRWAALSLVVLAPIIVQIFLFDIFLAAPNPGGIPMITIISLLAIFLAWYDWPKYAPLFRK